MKRLMVCVVVALTLVSGAVFAQLQMTDRQKMCQELCPLGQTWQESYDKFVGNLTQTSPQMQWGSVYDTIMVCVGDYISSSTPTKYSGKGWAVLHSKKGGLQDLFPTYLTDQVCMRTIVPGDLYAIRLKSASNPVILLKRTDNDVLIRPLTVFDTAQALQYGTTGVAKDATQAKVGWERLQMRRITELYEYSDAPDSLPRVWREKFHLPDVVQSPEDGHRDGVLPLESALFEDLGGIERCQVNLGDWTMLRFPGSQFVHFVYLGDWQAIR